MNTVATDRLSSPNPFLNGGSPVAGLVKELNSSLHLDSNSPNAPSSKPPAFEPYATPLLLRSRKRPMDERSSPAMALSGQSPGLLLGGGGALGLGANSPTTAFWSRNQGRRAGKEATPLLFRPESHSAKTEARAEGKSAATPLLFRRESLPTDSESSFDDDGSLTSLPRMRGLAAPEKPALGAEHTPSARPLRRGAALSGRMEYMLDSTPLRAQGSMVKRARSQTAGIPSFQPLGQVAEEGVLDASFSPSARTQPESHALPCFTAATDSIMRIEAETASRLLRGEFSAQFDEHVVVDCRFPYEYEGGHIAGAVNAPTAEALEQLLLARPITGRRVVVVLHCEYSIQRAPSMASMLRRRDREVNMHRYPHLHYPEIYVLQGGYRNFFSFHKQQCEPQSYVEMNDQQHARDCRQRMLQFDRQFKRTKSMDGALARSYSATVAGSALFAAQSPTMPPRSASSSSLPTRARRLGRTQSARPGIDLLDFSQH
ncbi:m-phase inducer phosphatase [Coemansia sp. RSA 2704]|nr:m-phase inducer phosphatase [Coemansia sp. RSA 2704]